MNERYLKISVSYSFAYTVVQTILVLAVVVLSTVSAYATNLNISDEDVKEISGKVTLIS